MDSCSIVLVLYLTSCVLMCVRESRFAQNTTPQLMLIFILLPCNSKCIEINTAYSSTIIITTTITMTSRTTVSRTATGMR